MDSDNIFKDPGEPAIIENLKSLYEGSKSVDLSEYPITSIVGLLKTYLSELPETPLTEKFFSQMLNASSKNKKFNCMLYIY